MPTVANGIDLDFDLARQPRREPRAARSSTAAPGWRGHGARARLPEPRQHGQLRRGDRRVPPASGVAPDITAAPPRRAALKYGFGLNADPGARRRWCARSRALGWSDGQNETLRLHRGRQHVRDRRRRRPARCWRRPDRQDSAWPSSPTASPASHREYLRLGGTGSSSATPARSAACVRARPAISTTRARRSSSTTTTSHVWRGVVRRRGRAVRRQPRLQPDRGPVWVFSSRAHLGALTSRSSASAANIARARPRRPVLGADATPYRRRHDPHAPIIGDAAPLIAARDARRRDANRPRAGRRDRRRRLLRHLVPALPPRARRPGRARARPRDLRVHVLLIDVEEDPARVRRFLAETQLPEGAQIALDRTGAVARRWGQDRFPTTFLRRR